MASSKCSPTIPHLLCFVVMFASFFHISTEFQWIHTPEAKTFAGIGKSVAVRWQYNLSSKESHFESELTFLREHLLTRIIATRDATADSFLTEENNQLGEFEVLGKTNISLVVKSIQKTCDGMLCLQVKYKHEGSIQRGKFSCTELHPIGSNVSDSIKVDVEVETSNSTILLIIAIVAGVIFVCVVVCFICFRRRC